MQARSGPMLRGQLAQEVDDFMAVQKNEHGFDLLDSRAKRFMVRAVLPCLNQSAASSHPHKSAPQACSPTCGCCLKGYVFALLPKRNRF